MSASRIIRPVPGRPVFEGLPQRHYRVIEADPNWTYEAYSSKGDGTRSASAHYDVDGVDKICALPVGELAHPEGCHLFLWTTWPNLPQAFQVAAAWGFEYSASGFVWVKTRPGYRGKTIDLREDIFMGLGHTTRKNTEPCLLFRKGAPRRRTKDVRELVIGPEDDDAVVGDGADWPPIWSPLGRHSAKPAEIYCRVEAYSEGPYLTLYSRTTPKGWDAWGFEAGRFDGGQLGRPAKVLGAEGLPLFGRVA